MNSLLRASFARLVETGAITLLDAGSSRYTYGDGQGTPVALRFTSPFWEFAVALDPELRLGEAYMEGGLVVEEGTIADFLDVLVKNKSVKRPNAWLRSLNSLRFLARRIFFDNTPRRSRRNAVHHYNIDYRIYRLFLDSDLQYSCAYFQDDNTSLDKAQLAKKRHIAAKLLLEPGQKVLDIGSGWGGLALYLARKAAVSVVGINLADEQVKIARQRALAERLPCEFRVQDYRTLSEQFDRIVSVGMFEHVGKAHYEEFFRKCRDILTDDGIMLLHTIGRWDGPAETNSWVWRYIFPGGYTPALSELAPAIEHSGLVVSDVEVLRLHYALTLRAWRTRFLANRNEVGRLFEENSSLAAQFGSAGRFVRMWEYFLAGAEASFRYGGLEVFQLQLAKRITAVPLTRDYIKRAERALVSPELREAAE